ncbi:DUF2218 domain-containing protein [Vibrio navarrensis]|uniref:DUF2218 domain-containing protein n=1 Tax=Vibrio navarrensis TaxID=29495 RepID=UPI00186681D3|nr:DUF2218 domain-containing protein [Vibrio navarrensis]MBE3651765.1 hypothetical protein [Vibrio navarrensis]
MLKQQTRIFSKHAGKYLVTLCRHFARKVPAQWDEYQGEVNFPVGKSLMQLDERTSSLTIICCAEDEEKLERQKATIASHVQMFSRREEIELIWQDC